METRSTLAVMDDSYFYTMGRKIPVSHQAADLADLFAMCQAQHFTHVWVVAGTKLSERCSCYQEGMKVPEWRNTLIMPGKNHAAYCSTIRDGQRAEQRLQVAFAAYIPWPWTGKDNPRTLLATLLLLEDALHLPLEWTAAHMALDVVKAKNVSRWDWFQALKMDLEGEHEFKYAESHHEIHHPGELLPGNFLIKLDGNSDYGAAMTGLRVGEGNPAWSSNAAIYDGKKPGFWRISADKLTSIFDGGQLPDFSSQRWMTTDMVEQLRKVGYSVQIEAGYFWEKYHQSLRSTVSNKDGTGLWDLRILWRGLQSKSEAHENVYESISAILHTVHGKLGDSDITQKRFFRRDIYALVVAMAVARKVYRIQRIKDMLGLLPSRVHIDACWYACESSDALDSIVDSEKLGGWKKVYVLPITEELRANWAEMTPGDLNMLARAAREEKK